MTTALLYGATYSLLGIALLMLGYVVVDLLTPGHLGRALTERGALGAGLVVGAEFLGLGAIVATAIWHNAGAGFGPALAWTAAFGLPGVLLQAVSLLVLGLVIPGDLRRIVVDPGLHPGALVTAAAQLAVSAVICASIT